MFVRSTLVLSSVTALMFGGPGAPAPVTTKYRIDLTNEQVIDLTSAGQGEQKMTSKFWGIVNVTLSDTAGGHSLHVVIDSVGGDLGPIPVPQATLDSARGAWIHGLVDSRGHVAGLRTSHDSSLVVLQVKSAIATFFPRTKPGFKTGDSWTDTTDVDNKGGGQNLKIRIVTNYTAQGQETVAGVNASKIGAAFSSSSAGTIENPMAGSMDVEGTETGTAAHFLAPDGRYLGGSATASGKMMIKAAMLPDPIPVKVTRGQTVTVLP